MAIPDFSMRQLLEAGVHFGHQTQRWNPKMSQYIYGSRNGIHIIDLTQTVPLLDAALNVISKTVADGGRVLFVGTKRQACQPIARSAESCAQYYMNHRWLGGTLTNWKTVSNSIDRLKDLDEILEKGADGLTKKERLGMEREQGKLQSSLGGIREMGGTPDLLFVIDVNKESLAVAEAQKLGIPIVAIVDTNCAPDGIDCIIPGNDDAARAVALYCDLAAKAALDGMNVQLNIAGVDVGALEDAPLEASLESEHALIGSEGDQSSQGDEDAREESVTLKETLNVEDVSGVENSPVEEKTSPSDDNLTAKAMSVTGKNLVKEASSSEEKNSTDADATDVPSEPKEETVER